MLLSLVLQHCEFLDQVLPKAVPLTRAPPRGAHPLPGGIRPLPAAAFPSCHDRCEEEPASSQADPGAFASLIPTLLPPTACIRWSWDASQPTNGTYLHSPQNSQSKPYSEVEK